MYLLYYENMRNPQQWGRKTSKRKKIHQPDKNKNMKVKKTSLSWSPNFRGGGAPE